LAIRVREPESIPEVLETAFRVATEGRPGPVLVDIPMDVQRMRIVPPAPSASAGSSGAAGLNLQAILEALSGAERPMILAGGGIDSGRAVEEFRAVVDRLGIPVVHSLMGCDLLPFSHPLRVGMIGTYGNRWANLALMRSDVLLVLGSRLDVRQTGSRTDLFGVGRRIFHVDCEPGEMNNRVKDCTAIVSELRPFLSQLASMPAGRPASSGWMDEIAGLRAQWPDTGELPGLTTINPNGLMHELSQRAGAIPAAYVVDVGQHQMWAAQSVEMHAGQRFLTSGGMGSMGFALPAAIGAALSVPGRPIVVIAGDGGFQCNIQELQTVARMNLPMKIVVVNNLCHGMVRQFQESYFDSRFQSTLWGYSAPDFEKVGAAYGIASLTVADPDQTRAAFEWLWADPSQPQLLQVMVESGINSYPKVAFGKAISEMEPFAQPTEMEST
jgi:acetolactate synthase-1/2/3 large subunit